MKASATILLNTLFVSQIAIATPTTDVLQINSALFKDKPVFCEEEILSPTKNDFDLVDYDLMNSESGDRYAIIHIKNTSSGQRILKRENLVAILANCNSLYPENLNQTLPGRSTVTKSIYFGKHQFPIIKIITGNEI